jgi:hypothetical protein
MRRLTIAEYNNSVRDLLGSTTQPANEFPPDTQSGIFDNSVEQQTVPELLADQYLSAAATLAQAVDVPKLLGCDPASGSACVTSFVQKFGRRAYRRPLMADEVSALMGVYSGIVPSADAATGVQGVIAAILVSPNFLFRPEFGDATPTLPNATRLTPYETAARLASLLWASVPDDTLLDAAAAGQLATKEQVAAQARRMLTDAKAKAAVASFYDQWFGLSLLDSATKDANAYPTFDDNLRASMKEETRELVAHVIWNDDARLSTLLTAPYSFVNGPLAALYGISGPVGGSYQKVTLDPEQRLGLLTQASLLTAFGRTNESSPVKRGKWIWTRLLCEDMPEPPPGVPPLPQAKTGVSNRDALLAHTADPACASCHDRIDGLGFGLENYDGIGAYRTTDQGVPVDPTGTIVETNDINGAFTGVKALTGLLLRSTELSQCAPTQWFRYLIARHETVDDACSVVAVREAFAKSGGDLRELMVTLTQTDAFLNYRPAQ